MAQGTSGIGVNMKAGGDRPPNRLGLTILYRFTVYRRLGFDVCVCVLVGGWEYVWEYVTIAATAIDAA